MSSVSRKSRFLRTCAYVGGTCSLYTLAHDYIIPTPNQSKHFEQFKDKKQRNIIIVGGGLMGMSSAYFLSKNPQNKIEIIDQSQKPYNAQEHIYGPLLSKDFSEPMTNSPLLKTLRGIVKADTSNSIFLMDSIKQPGIWRFIRFWLTQNTSRSRSDQTLIMQRLLDEN